MSTLENRNILIVAFKSKLTASIPVLLSQFSSEICLQTGSNIPLQKLRNAPVERSQSQFCSFVHTQALGLVYGKDTFGVNTVASFELAKF